MAPKELIDEPWPAEGQTLGEIIERLLTPELWAELLYHVGDSPTLPPPPSALSRNRQILPLRVAAHGPLSHAGIADALAPLIEAWNSGEITATGRRGSPLAEVKPIPPPNTGYVLVIKSALRSVIVEPPGREVCWYDVRFQRQKQPTSRMTYRQHLEQIVKENSFPGPEDRAKHGWKKKFIRETIVPLLVERHAVDAVDANAVKIAFSRMSEYGLWPK